MRTALIEKNAAYFKGKSVRTQAAAQASSMFAARGRLGGCDMSAMAFKAMENVERPRDVITIIHARLGPR